MGRLSATSLGAFSKQTMEMREKPMPILTINQLFQEISQVSDCLESIASQASSLSNAEGELNQEDLEAVAGGLGFTPINGACCGGSCGFIGSTRGLR